MRALLTLLVVALLAGGCGVTAPSPRPGDMTDVLAALALRGATIHQQVSGDPGCTGSPLHSNAVRLELTLAGDETEYLVYLFRWRRAEQFDAAEQAFSDCVDQFVAEAEGEVPVEGVEVFPWRAYGPGWNDELIEAIEAALRAAARGAAAQ